MKKQRLILPLTAAERTVFAKLTTPARIQDFLNSLGRNKESNGQTLYSPRRVLREKKAHCIEGALFAAAVLWYHGHKPLLLDLKTTARDFDHVVTLFKRNGYWGAISKTSHAVLRYREPVYKTVRELALSYFHEYFLDDGTKTLRSYSRPFSLARLGTSWITSEDPLFEIGGALDDARHVAIAPTKNLRNLRKADAVEIKAGKLVEYSA